MRKLPRRSPSNSPSLAWVAFAVLGLSVAGGIGGLYAHRQNRETSRRHQLAELGREIEALHERNAALTDEFNARVLAPTLQLAVKVNKLPLVRIAPESLRHVPAREAPPSLARNP